MGRLEGNGASRFIRLMQIYGKNDSMNVDYATITAVNPFKLRIDGWRFDLESDDFEICEYLSKHKRQVRISGGEVVGLEFQDELKVEDRVVVVSYNNGQRFIVLDRVVGFED
ncbi:DUF2577 family protein [Gottfriedia luciferensis]|uniref:DUF2577 family protein n=1 Tax=Gottfriedia luciferensis TaxID=178774 RepID=UPI000B440BCB|nr:DUF2577 family protein [Gottfriedia luciferensis]